MVGWSVHTLSERHHFTSLAGGGDHDGVVTLGLARGRKFLGALFGGEEGPDLTLAQGRLPRLAVAPSTPHSALNGTLRRLISPPRPVALAMYICGPGLLPAADELLAGAAAKPGPTAGVQGGRGVGGSVLPVTHLRLGIVQRVHRVVHLHVGGGPHLELLHRLAQSLLRLAQDDAERVLSRWSVRLSCESPVYLLSGAKAHPLWWASAPARWSLRGHGEGAPLVSPPLTRAAPKGFKV
jgi:hypothetical protein